MGLTKVCALTTKDEILPGGDGLDHDGGVVPTGDTVEDIRIGPLACLKIEDNKVCELRLRVPASIGVEFVVDYEDGITTAAHRRGLGLLDRLVLVPRLCLQIEREYVCEGGAGIVQTTMATVDVYLVVGIAISHVGPGSWSTNC